MKVIGTGYHSVSKMVRDISEPEFADAFDAYQAERRIIKQLMLQRVVKGLSQKDLAEILHCTQSCISKMESCTDGELSIDEIRRYARAVGFNLNIEFTDQQSTRAEDRNGRKGKARTKRSLSVSGK